MTPRGNRIKRNLLELNVMLVVRAVARLISAVLLVDRLGLSGYGKMAWAMTLTYVVVADDLGLGDWAMRAAARDPRWYRESTSGFLVMSIAATVVRFGILLVVLPWMCPDAATRSLTIGFASASFVMMVSLGWLHFARERMSALRNSSVVREIAWLAGVLVLVHSPADLRRLPVLYFACEALAVVMTNLPAVMAEGLPRRRVRMPPLREIFGLAIPAWIGGRVFSLRPQLGTLVLGATMGSAEVATFDLAWRVAYNVWLVGATCLGAVTPALMMHAHDAGERFWLLLRRSVRIAYVLALAAPVLGAAALHPLVTLVLGRKGDPVVVPLELLLIMTVPAILRGTLRSGLFALGRKLTLGVLAVLEIVGLGVAMFWARRAGAEGLAVSLAAIEAALAIATGWALVRRGVFAAMAAGWRAAVVAVVAYAATVAAGSLGALVQILTGIAVYVAATWVLEPAMRQTIGLLRGELELPPSGLS